MGTCVYAQSVLDPCNIHGNIGGLAESYDYCGQLRRKYTTVNTNQDGFNFCVLQFAESYVTAGSVDNVTFIAQSVTFALLNTQNDVT